LVIAAVWFVLQGAALAFGAVRPPRGGVFRRAAVHSFRAAAVAEFVVNFYAFPLPGELALPVGVVLVGGMRIVVFS
jgi:hypothetical protein